MSAIQEFLQAVNGTKPGECLGKCGKMITKEDKDHALCNACWDQEFKKMPVVHVSFQDDNPETLMKPPPTEVRTFHRDDPPSDISSTSSEEEEPELKRNPKAWVPPHMRKKAAGPTPLERKKSVHDLSLQCDEEFRSKDAEIKQLGHSEHEDYCPGCESGCDADAPHRAGHDGDGYHPNCYISRCDQCMWCGRPCEVDYCSARCYRAEEMSMGIN